MRNDHNRRYRMGLSVRDVVNEFTANIATVPGLKGCADNFLAQLGVLEEGTKATLKTTKGATQSKNLLRDKVAESSFSIANAIWLHANSTNNAELKEGLPVNLSDYQRGKEAEVMGRIAAVLELAKTHEREIAPFGITPEFIAAATDDFRLFGGKIGSPANVRSAIALKNEDLDNDFKEMMSVLESLDRAVNAVMAQFPELHKAYTKARIIGTTGSRKDKPAPEAARSTPPADAPTNRAAENRPAPILMGGGPYERPRPE